MPTPKGINFQQNFKQIPVLGLVVEQAGSAPATPPDGQVYYDTGLAKFRGRENGAWVNLVTPNALTSASTAGGDLSGTLSNLQIVASAVGTTEIADLAVTDAKVAAANKDGAAGTPSMRTLAFTTGTAMPGDARLDQLAVPTAAISMGLQKITNLAVPTAGTDATTKNYVDNLAAGLDPKGSVKAATTANIAGITYAATGGTSARGQITAAPSVLDGVTLALNDRLLLKDMTDGTVNGIWKVSTLGTGANGVWDRATDFDNDNEVTAGAFTFVEQGTVNDNTGWMLATNNPITIGGASGTALVWTQFNGGTSLTAGAGLTQSGNVFNVVGTAGRVSVAADSIDIDVNYVGQTSITTLGTVTTGTWNGTAIGVAYGGTGATTVAGAKTALGFMTLYEQDLPALTAGVEVLVTHNLGRKRCHVSITRIADDVEEGFGIRYASTTQVGVTSDVPWAATTLHIVVIG